MKHDYLVEWDYLDLRIRGNRIQQLVAEKLREKHAPVSHLRLKFLDGEIQISARIQKTLTVPVKLTVRKITASGKILKVVLDDVATFGVLPIPKLLFQIIGSRRLPGGLGFDPKTLTLTISLERFVPSFVDITLEDIQVIRGGICVRLGRGGADPPSPAGISSAHRHPTNTR